MDDVTSLHLSPPAGLLRTLRWAMHQTSNYDLRRINDLLSAALASIFYTNRMDRNRVLIRRDLGMDGWHLFHNLPLRRQTCVVQNQEGQNIDTGVLAPKLTQKIVGLLHG